MTEIWDAVQNWPVILQGLIASALFWLLVKLGEMLASAVSSRAAKLSRKAQMNALVTDLLRHQAYASDGHQEGSVYAVLLVYRMSRDLLKGLMWLALGQIFGSVVGIVSIVGYLGCLYFLFAAYTVVRPMQQPLTLEQTENRIKELEEKIAKLGDDH